MKIKRRINGEEMEIELTYAEEREIFCHWNDECAKEDCAWDDEYENLYGITEEEYEKLLPDIVKSYQDIRGMDECWTNDRDIAIEEVIRRYKNAD